jgi:hypothetical protein
MSITLLQYLISFVSVLFILLHMIFPKITIDSITLGLIVIAVLPWMAPLFKVVELPGGLKVEFQKLLSAEKKADDLGLLSNIKDDKKIHEYESKFIERKDPNLALAGLRIEIEHKLREVAGKSNISFDGGAIQRLVNQMVNERIFNKSEGQVINELLTLLNQATHGAKVDPLAIEWVNTVGPKILYALDHR